MPATPGFANSFGQRNWYTAPSFNLDWSFFHDADKAVKASYAGTEWDADEFERKVALAVEQLGVLARPARALRPGSYRVYLAPSALFEILGVLSWGGFGLRAHRTKTTPLIKMVEEALRLHPSVSVLENTADGIAPDFQGAGFIRPPRVVAGRRRRLPRLPGVAALGRRVRRRDQRRLGERGAGVDRDGRRQRSPPTTCCASCTPACTSATSGT